MIIYLGEDLYQTFLFNTEHEVIVKISKGLTIRKGMKVSINMNYKHECDITYESKFMFRYTKTIKKTTTIMKFRTWYFFINSNRLDYIRESSITNFDYTNANLKNI